MTSGSHNHRRIWAVLGVALVLRLVVWGGLEWMLENRWEREFVVPGDADGYWHLAGDISEGRKYAIFEPPRQVLRMPGFPAILALFRLVGGEQLWFARLCLSLVGVSCCWLTYLLGKELYDETVGLWAALGAAVSPALIGSSPLVLSETAFAATLLLSLWSGVKLIRTLSSVTPSQEWICWSITCGLANAATCYMRPSWLLAVPGFAVLLPILIRPRLRASSAGLAVVVVMLAALAPWGMRNQKVSGHFVLTTLWMGPSLYDGLHDGANGESDMTFFDRDNLLANGMTEYDVDQHYRRLAWSFVRENPGRALQLAFIKLWRYWSPWPNADQFNNRALQSVVALGSLVTLVLAIRGIVSPRTHSDPWRWIIAAGPIVYLSLLHLLFVGSMRYRLPAEYALLVLSGEGWLAWRGHVVGTPFVQAAPETSLS